MVAKLVFSLFAIAAAVTWGALAVLVGGTSPESLTARLFFFIFLFIGSLFTFAAAFHLILNISTSTLRQQKLRSSMLLGIAPAAGLVTALWLQSFRALGLASGLTILVIALVVELVTAVKGRGSSDATRTQKVGY